MPHLTGEKEVHWKKNKIYASNAPGNDVLEGDSLGQICEHE